MTEGAGCDIIFKETSARGKGNEKYMIYEIADLRIQIKNRCSFTTEFCKGYLAADQAQPPDLSAAASEQAFSEEKKSCPAYSDGYIENICIYRDLCLRLPRLERFLLHAAVLDYKGEGYALLGRSGAGKSTHTGLWLKYLPKAKILNGDKPIVARTESGFYAYGTPWMGKEGRGEKGRAPLKGLCFLEQAKENSLVRLSEGEVASRIFTQLLLPTDEENAAKTLELADALISAVPAYLLKCTISEEAVKLSFEALTGKSYEREI